MKRLVEDVTIPKFSRSENCAKCGTVMVGDGGATSSGVEYLTEVPVHRADLLGMLRVRCVVCGFVVIRRPLDAPDREAA